MSRILAACATALTFFSDSNRVEFDVKPEHVGDFLATLSVVEHGGSSVRSASFPIKVEEAEQAPRRGR